MDTISVLADMSLVLVAIEFLVLTAVPLLILYFINRGVRWLNVHLRLWLRQVQAGSGKVQNVVTQSARTVLKPFVALSVYLAQLRGLVRGVGKALSGKF